MKTVHLFIIAALPLLLSCGGTTYHLVAKGQGAAPGASFNVKHAIGCCGCSHAIINTFQYRRLESQLFLEGDNCSSRGVKYVFHYDGKGTLLRMDTLIAVADESFHFPLTALDKVALSKLDSFILTQGSSLYRLKRTDATGFRKLAAGDSIGRLLSPAMERKALR